MKSRTAKSDSGSIQAFYAGRGVSNYVTASHASGLYIWDTDGNRLFDGSSGAVVSNLGHGNTHVREAMIRQAEKISYAVRSVYASESAVRLAKMLTEMAGPGFEQAYPVSGGSEAIESAIKLARQYAYARGQKNRWKVLARDPGYHGATLGAAAITGDPQRDEIFGPMMRIMPKVPAPFTYRVPEGFDTQTYTQHCVEALDTAILDEGPENVLAFIMEPVGGIATGALVSPDFYYKAVRDICDKYGVLLIYDEVMSGSGRTGTFLAARHWPEVQPDIVVLAKGVGAGYTPLGAMLAPNHIVDEVAASGGFLHGHTYAGNPLSAAIGVAVLEEIQTHDLMSNAERMGRLLRDRLRGLMDQTSVIGDVRGMGLLNAIELVADKEKKTLFSSKAQAAYRVMEIGRRHGLLMYARRAADGKYGEWMMIAPPLIITEAQVGEYIDMLSATIADYEKEIGR